MRTQPQRAQTASCADLIEGCLAASGKVGSQREKTTGHFRTRLAETALIIYNAAIYRQLNTTSWIPESHLRNVACVVWQLFLAHGTIPGGVHGDAEILICPAEWAHVQEEANVCLESRRKDPVFMLKYTFTDWAFFSFPLINFVVSHGKQSGRF